jgi:cytochrome c553
LATLVMLVAIPLAAMAEDFEAMLARVDQALRDNPNHVVAHALDTCHNRRAFAVRLHRSGQDARAVRSLRYCTGLLKITASKTTPEVDREKLLAQSIARVQAKAARELRQALVLEPDLENGLEIYRGCAACHMPEGWGLASGVVPQLAGQHRKVVIKQLADIRSGNRDNALMIPYATVKAIGGPQSLADVAGYIDTLEISVENGKGSGQDLDLGEHLYVENCVRCHGEKGEGNGDRYRPRIQSQHYNYLVNQFEQIRAGKRRNADPEMVVQVEAFNDREMRAVLDYVSRLVPPEELQAPEGWHNPDFDEVAGTR